MKINFNTMPKMQGFGGNCIGRTTQKNIKGAMAQRVSQAVNKRTNQNHNAEQFELINVPSNQVLPQNTSKRMSSNQEFITKRSVHSSDDYNFLSTTEIEDVDLLANNNVDKMTGLVSEISGDDIDKKLEVVDKLDTSEEKKHDILMNGEISTYFGFVDTIQLDKEENFKRKLVFIDEAFQDEETRKEKHAKFVKGYNSNTLSQVENEMKNISTVKNYHQEAKRSDVNSLTSMDLNKTKTEKLSDITFDKNSPKISEQTNKKYSNYDISSEGENEIHFAVEDYPQNYDASDIEILSEGKLYKMIQLLDKECGDNDSKRARIIAGLSISKELSHDLRINNAINARLNSIDSLNISDEEKRDNKLAIINSEYQDKEMKELKYYEILAVYNARISGNDVSFANENEHHINYGAYLQDYDEEDLEIFQNSGNNIRRN